MIEDGLQEDGSVMFRFMKRDHHAAGGSTPRRNKVHDSETDQEVRVEHIIPEMLGLARLKDGDEFEILITPTGRRPHGDRWFLFPEERPETDKEVLERIENIANQPKNG